jgi:ribosomal protein L34E
MMIENAKKRTFIRRFPTASSDRKARTKEVTRSQNEYSQINAIASIRPQQVGQLSKIHRNPSRLIPREQLRD